MFKLAPDKVFPSSYHYEVNVNCTQNNNTLVFTLVLFKFWLRY